MHSRGPKDQLTEQANCSIPVDPATTKGLEISQNRDTPPPSFSTCCPKEEDWSLLVNKGAAQASQSQPVNPKVSLGFRRWRSVITPSTPEGPSHISVGAERGDTGHKMSLLHVDWRCCLSLKPTCLLSPRTAWPIRKPKATAKQKRYPHSGHTERTSCGIQGNQQPAWLTYIFK